MPKWPRMAEKATEMENNVLKPCSVYVAVDVYAHCYLYPNSTSTEKLPLKIEGGRGSEIWFLVL